MLREFQLIKCSNHSRALMKRLLRNQNQNGTFSIWLQKKVKKNFQIIYMFTFTATQLQHRIIEKSQIFMSPVNNWVHRKYRRCPIRTYKVKNGVYSRCVRVTFTVNTNTALYLVHYSDSNNSKVLLLTRNTYLFIFKFLIGCYIALTQSVASIHQTHRCLFSERHIIRLPAR